MRPMPVGGGAVKKNGKAPGFLLPWELHDLRAGIRAWGSTLPPELLRSVRWVVEFVHPEVWPLTKWVQGDGEMNTGLRAHSKVPPHLCGGAILRRYPVRGYVGILRGQQQGERVRAGPGRGPGCVV